MAQPLPSGPGRHKYLKRKVKKIAQHRIRAARVRAAALAGIEKFQMSRILNTEPRTLDQDPQAPSFKPQAHQGTSHKHQAPSYKPQA